MKTISAGCLAIFMALMAWAQAPSPSIYKIDADRSKVEINVFKGGLFQVLGHDHLIAARRFSGTVQFDTGKIKDSSVSLSIDSGSLVVLDPQAPEKDRSEAQSKMEGPEVLNETAFPLITFHSTRISDFAQSGDSLDVTLSGRLNLHGVEKEITFPVHIRFQNNLLQATGTATIAQTNFGIVPLKAVGGTVRVKDQLKIRFDILAEKTS